MRHADDHIHLLATTVRADGRRPRTHRDGQRAQHECRKIEAEFGLRQLKSGDLTAPRTLTGAEHAKARRKGRQATSRQWLREQAYAVATAVRAETEYFAVLESQPAHRRQALRDGLRHLMTADITQLTRDGAPLTILAAWPHAFTAAGRDLATLAGTGLGADETARTIGRRPAAWPAEHSLVREGGGRPHEVGVSEVVALLVYAGEKVLSFARRGHPRDLQSRSAAVPRPSIGIEQAPKGLSAAPLEPIGQGAPGEAGAVEVGRVDKRGKPLAETDALVKTTYQGLRLPVGLTGQASRQVERTNEILNNRTAGAARHAPPGRAPWRRLPARNYFAGTSIAGSSFTCGSASRRKFCHAVPFSGAA